MACSDAIIRVVVASYTKKTLFSITLLATLPMTGYSLSAIQHFKSLKFVKFLETTSQSVSFWSVLSSKISRLSDRTCAASYSHSPVSYCSQTNFLRYRNILNLTSQSAQFLLMPLYMELLEARTSLLAISLIFGLGLFNPTSLSTSFHSAVSRNLLDLSSDSFSLVLCSIFLRQLTNNLSLMGGVTIICTQFTSLEQVSPLTKMVSTAMPLIQKTVSSLNLWGRESSTPIMRARQSPNAPLSPPYTSTTNSFLLSPQPYNLRMGQKLATITNLMTIIRPQKMNMRTQSAIVMVDLSIISTPMMMPVIRKIRVSQAYWMYDQITCSECSLQGQILVLPTADMYRPSTTIARIPDTFTQVNSAIQKHMQQDTKVRLAVSTSSLTILFSQRLVTKPTATPSRGPPIPILRKLRTTSVAELEVPLARLRNSMKKTIAVPSLSRLSPSMRVLNLTLAPRSLRRATTATGSVAESTHPRVKAWYHVSSLSSQPSRTLKHVPSRMAPHSTPGAARIRMFTMALRNTNQSQLNPEITIWATGLEDQHRDEDEQDHVGVQLLDNRRRVAHHPQVVPQVAQDQARQDQHRRVRKFGLLVHLTEQPAQQQAEKHEENHQRTGMLFMLTVTLLRL